MSFNITMPKITQQIQPDDLNLTAEDNSSPLSDYFSLSRTQRLYAFGICAVIGLILCALSLMMLGLVNLAGFAIFYSLGNVVALLGTMFLVGPMRQIKMAFEPVRIIATIVFIVTLVLTFVAALALHSVILSIIMVILQFCALVWYCASYIPFGRKIIKKVCGSCLP